MNVIPFVAESAADAVTQIRSRLGSEAVVLNVRKLPVTGMARFWRKPRIEVLAHLPELPAAPLPARILDVREGENPPEIATTTMMPPAAANELEPGGPIEESTPEVPPEPNRFAMPDSRSGKWRSGPLLHTMGILPLHIDRVMEQLQGGPDQRAPDLLASELALTRKTLASFWRESRLSARGTHVFVGPPGSGKTTALCKWLTQSSLVQGAKTRVWRLDASRANTAEALSVHCEILNVPLERAWNPDVTWPEEFLFVDLPGVETGDTAGIAGLQSVLSTIPHANVSLVLNAAYETNVLQAQIRAFSSLPINHLLFTHMDEERCWSKLWNFVLGTNYSLNFFSAGQNIPGQFMEATPELLLPPSISGS